MTCIAHTVGHSYMQKLDFDVSCSLVHTLFPCHYTRPYIFHTNSVGCLELDVSEMLLYTGSLNAEHFHAQTL